MDDEEMSDAVMVSEQPPIQKQSISFWFRQPLHRWSLVPEFKLILIIRMGGEETTMCPSNRNMLSSMRLQKVNTGVFFKADEGLMAILRKLRPFVGYRYPTVEDAKKLICNFAAVKLEQRAIPLKLGDHVVEQAFGRYNIHCIEDVANEIANVGPHFKDVSSSICPILLAPRRPTYLGRKRRKKRGLAGLIGNLRIT